VAISAVPRILFPAARIKERASALTAASGEESTHQIPQLSTVRFIQRAFWKKRGGHQRGLVLKEGGWGG